MVTFSRLARRVVVIHILQHTQQSRWTQALMLRMLLDSDAATLAEFDQVGYLAATTGEYSLNASISAKTNAELLDFVERHIAKSDGVRRINISLIMRLYKVFNTRTTALGRDSHGHRATG